MSEAVLQVLLILCLSHLFHQGKMGGRRRKVARSRGVILHTPRPSVCVCVCVGGKIQKDKKATKQLGKDICTLHIWQGIIKFFFSIFYLANESEMEGGRERERAEKVT